MNIKPMKIVAVTSILMTALVLLGVLGTMTTASAAGVTINSGTPVTNYTQVLLEIDPPTVAFQMSIQNDDSPGVPTWVELPALWPFTEKWNLAATVGPKTVSIRFRDSSLLPIAGKYSGKIYLDYSLDTSFSNSYGYDNRGIQLPGNVTSSANGVAIDSQGRKIVVGTADMGNGSTRLAVIRYLEDGSTLDLGFGVNGSFSFYNPSVVTSKCVGKAVAIGANDSIFVVGSYDQDGAGNTDILILKLLDNGTLDTNFKGNPFALGGSVVYENVGTDSGNAVVLDGNGRIVVVGTYDDSSNGNGKQAIVIRLLPDGSPDGSFADQGTFIFGGPGDDSGNAVALDAFGDIVVAGSYDHGGGVTSAWLFRLDPDGLIDNFFGVNGDIAYGGETGADTAHAVAVDPDGNIVVVGTYDWTGGDTDIWVMKLLRNGSLDPSFNGSGSRSFGGTGADSGNAVAIQGANIIVVGTYDNGGGQTSLWASRLLLSDGSFDLSFNHGSDYLFGSAGRVTGQAVALQADDKIVVTGAGYQVDSQKNLPSSLLTMRLHGTTSTLTVTTIGSGSVTVFPGILTNGTGEFVPGSIIELTATPINGAIFDGWTGDCSGSGICTVTMDAAKKVTAIFTLSHPLTVSVNGVGTVVSTPGTIVCNSVSGAGCSGVFLDGTSVTLTATSPTWYSLPGSFWSGGSCSGSTSVPCVVTMNQAWTVTASYFANLTVRVVGFGDYPTLMQAYGVANSSGPTATIQAKDSTQVVFSEAPMNLALPVTVTFQGGKGSDFNADAVGFTSVIGPLNISNGRLNARNLKIKQP